MLNYKKNSGEPIYITITNNLRREIIEGKWNPGDLLPSENYLAKEYNTSRETVRKSMNFLENSGLTYSRPGKGYFVCVPNHNSFTMNFSENDKKTKFKSINVINPPTYIQKIMSLRKNKKIIEVKRIILSQEKPTAYDIKYILYDKGLPSIENEINYAVFPEIVAAKTPPFSFYTDMEITADMGTQEIRNELNCDEREPLLLIKRYFFNQDGIVIGFGEKYLKQEYGDLKAYSGYLDR